MMPAPSPAGHSLGAAASSLASLIVTASIGKLDEIAALVWRGVANNHVTEAEAAFLCAEIQARRAPKALAALGAYMTRRPSTRRRFGAARPASVRRRRQLAASGPMPPALAAQFTTGELAALKIVADEVRKTGDCRLPIEAIAARAGVSRTTVQNALRAAGPSRMTAQGPEGAGLLHVQRRPQRGRKSLTNIVTITSTGWLAWLTHRGQKADPIGFKIENPTVIKRLNERQSPVETQQHLLLPIPGGKAAGLGKMEDRAGAPPLPIRVSAR